MGCHALLQATVPTQGLKPAVLHIGRTLYRLSHQGNRRKQLSTPGRGALDVEKQVSAPEWAHATCTHGGRSSSARGALVSFSQIRGGVSTRLPSFWPLPVSLACLGLLFLTVILTALLENVAWFTSTFLFIRQVSNIECTHKATCTFP